MGRVRWPTGQSSITSGIACYRFLRRRHKADRGGNPDLDVFGRRGVLRPQTGCVSRREPAMKPVGKPDAGNPHVRFDERGRETERPQRRHRARPRLYLAHELSERDARGPEEHEL